MIISLNSIIWSIYVTEKQRTFCELGKELNQSVNKSIFSPVTFYKFNGVDCFQFIFLQYILYSSATLKYSVLFISRFAW
jgi:hypothetical protein